MKKNLFIMSAVFVMVITNVNAQLEKGNSIVGVNYGVLPNPGGWFLLIEASAATSNDIDVRYTGPVGITYQYMVTDKIGFGVDATYGLRSAHYTGDVEGNYSLKQSFIRAMARLSWEFVSTEKVQVNWATSAGYRKANWTVSGPDADTYDLNLLEAITNPVAFKTGLGVRYWPVEKLGITLDAMWGGGSFVNAGIVTKF